LGVHPDPKIPFLNHQKIIDDAEKKVTGNDVKSLLKCVGVSTSGKGKGILAQENRSKKTQLENAVIVAAIVVAIPVESSHNIPVSANLAEYVKVLREHNLIEDMATLKSKLTKMPRTRNKEGNAVRDALVMTSGFDADMEAEASGNTDELQKALRAQKETDLLSAQKENSAIQRKKQLAETRIDQVKEWVARFVDTAYRDSSRVRSNRATEVAKSEDSRPNIRALQAYCRDQGLIPTGTIEVLALRALQPTDDDKVALVEPKATKGGHMQFLANNDVYLKQTAKADDVAAKALIVAEYIYSETGGDGSLWDTVPEGLKIRIGKDPPSDGFRVTNLYTGLKQNFPAKPKKKTKEEQNE